MLTLITGLPGSGKTLWTVSHAWSSYSERTIYVHGIPELTLPHEILENPQDWHTLPTGAVVVIDEAQTVFRPRGPSAAVPEYVSAFETHRHRGHDVLLMTQHPMLIDSAVRRQVGRHLHINRRPGGSTVIHEWDHCINDVSDKNELRISQKHIWRYPKSQFSNYKSSSLHTKQVRSFPKRILLIPLFLGMIGYAGYTVYGMVNKYRVTPDQAVKNITYPASMPISVPGQNPSSVPAPAPAPAEKPVPTINRHPFVRLTGVVMYGNKKMVVLDDGGNVIVQPFDKLNCQTDELGFMSCTADGLVIDAHSGSGKTLQTAALGQPSEAAAASLAPAVSSHP